jgi:FlaA1/EpsC-like NDP-sugar epimerase
MAIGNKQNMSKDLCVIGARQATGLEIIKRSSKEPNEVVKEIRAFVRENALSLENLKSLQDERIKIFVGDCNKPETLRSALNGANIYFAASGSRDQNFEVDEIGVKNTADVALQEGVERVVLMSSQLVHPDNSWNFIRIMLNVLVSSGIMTRKFKGENLRRRYYT